VSSVRSSMRDLPKVAAGRSKIAMRKPHGDQQDAVR
jgi:hypothetical protein